MSFFFTLVSVICCCLSINNICRVTTLKVQYKCRYRLLKFWQFNAYKYGSERLQRVTSWVGDITNPEVYINPAPRNMQQRGRGREEEELLTCRQN